MYPRIAKGEISRIPGEKLREIRILKVADPIRHAEMAKVGDGGDITAFHFAKHKVRKFPFVFVRA